MQQINLIGGLHAKPSSSDDLGKIIGEKEYDVQIVIPPVAFVSYPHFEAIELATNLAKNNYKVFINESNISYLDRFEEIYGDAIKSVIKQGSKNYQKIKYYRLLFKCYDLDGNSEFLFDELLKDSEYNDAWLASYKKSKVLFFIFSYSRTPFSAIRWVWKMAEQLKINDPQVKIFIGGSGLRCLNDDLLKQIITPNIDGVFLTHDYGSLDHYLKTGELVNSVINNNGAILRTKVNHYEELFIRPDYSFVDSEKYLNFRLGTRLLSLSFTRGCVNNCAFCAEPYIFNPYREREINDVVEEIIELNKTNNVCRFRFNDSVLNANPFRIRQLCNCILNKKIKVYWGGMVRAKNTSLRLLKKMKEAGCRFLWLGMESASQKTLDRVKKNIRVSDVRKALINMKRAGIFSVLFIMSFPWETETEFKKTLEFLRKNKDYIDSIYVSSLRVYPNTPVFQNSEQFGIHLMNASDLTLTDTIPYAEANTARVSEIKKVWRQVKKTKNKVFYVENQPIVTEL